MTYLVLARKWRPRSFDTLVGQDHVVRALTHALTTQRLHHAWLFTGTRGVGKTTLSRILAKSLNCETGITATPCGVCQACTEIDAGRFVDYLELDAASNRGVEEMTQLLEQAVYSPGAGRFKVYMIDEVHMLTGHAFNAMLKTLEEPPPHVKFILATTDPQKIPVTVLSRCLQFNLKQMPGEAIVGHLQSVLGQEHIPFEVPALRMLGQAAQGSMRDALSLTDQAIAYSAGNLTEEAVRGMLGTIDQRHLIRLIDALQTGQASAVLEIADELSMRGLSYRAALADLAVLLSRIAIIQRVAQAADASDPLVEDLKRLAATLHPDALQLFYTVAVHSRAELSIAPDEYAGFVMACLRMLSVYAGNHSGAQLTATAAASAPVQSAATQQATPVPQMAPAAPAAISDEPAPAPVQAAPVPSSGSSTPPWEEEPEAFAQDGSNFLMDEAQLVPAVDVPAPSQSPVVASPPRALDSIVLPEPWPAFVAKLSLSGLASQLARQSECVGVAGQVISLRVPTRALTEGPHTDRLRTVLTEYFGFPVQFQFEVAAGQGHSAHALDLADKQARQAAAEQSVHTDPFVQALVADFGAHVVPGSVRPGT
jgi:DNA polymerase-3 subunit gamma/tau